MQGRKKDLATLIRNKVPAALPVHCLVHSLNLCLQDASREILLLWDAIDIAKKIEKLINSSPKRKYLFHENLWQCEDREIHAIRPLCLTCWTVHTGAIHVFIKSYAAILDTLEEIHHTIHDEYGVKATGLLTILDKFVVYFGLKLGLQLFGTAEEVSTVLKTKNLVSSGSCILSKYMYNQAILQMTKSLIDFLIIQQYSLKAQPKITQIQKSTVTIGWRQSSYIKGLLLLLVFWSLWLTRKWYWITTWTKRIYGASPCNSRTFIQDLKWKDSCQQFKL